MNNNKKQEQVFCFPEYRVPYNHFLCDATRRLMTVKDQFLSQIHGSEHKGPKNIQFSGDNNESDNMIMKFELSMPFESIQTTNIDDFLLMIENAAESGLSSLMPQIFSQLGKISELNGQTINGAGKSIYEQLLEGLEKMDLSFDEEGNHSISLIVNPEVKKLLDESTPTKEQLRMRDEILERKRAEYFAKKRTRRLR